MQNLSESEEDNNKTYITEKGFIRSLKNHTPYDESVFIDFCKELGMQCSFSNGIIFVRTRICFWRIFHDYRKVTEIWHQNMGNKQPKGMFCNQKFTSGFHRQNVDFYDYKEALQYIHDHDEAYLFVK